MARIDLLKKKIDAYLRKEQLMRKEEYTKLEKPFLKKARKNFTVANLMFKISEQDHFKKALTLPEDFETYEWVIVVSYYSMYVSALAALAKIGFKSRSHAATIVVLEHRYVHQQKNLGTKRIQQLTKAYALSEELINKLIQTKTRRETAQYDATPLISRENAVSALEDAEGFITKMEEILTSS
ncbi:MAG: HEPN domain-containing protein [Nanoarchaeota archaeon]